MKKMKLSSGAWGYRRFDYNGQIWVTNGAALVDSRYVSLERTKIDSLVPEKNEGSNIEIVVWKYEDVVSRSIALTEFGRQEQKELYADIEVNRIKIGFKNKIQAKNFPSNIGISSVILFIDGNWYSWFADMNKEKHFELFGHDKFYPVFLVNHKLKQVVGSVMPLRYS